MAYLRYPKKELYEKAIKVIENNNLFFFDDVIAFLPCDRATFYRRFPLDSPEHRDMVDKMELNRVKTKSSIRHKLYSMDNPTAQLALYRMLATPEERKAISLTYTDVTTNGKALVKDMPLEELNKEIQRLAKLQEEDNE